MVPLNDKDFIIDVPQFLSMEVVLVCNLYLGSINHSILTINEINRRNVRVKGIVFNGDENPETMEFILNYSGWDLLLHIPRLAAVSSKELMHYAEIVRPALFV